MAIRLPPIRGRRYYEVGKIAKNTDRIVMFEPLQAGTRVGMITYDGYLISEDERELYENAEVELLTFAVPAIGEHAREIPNTEAVLKGYAKSFLALVEETDPDMSWTPTETDYELSQATTTALTYDPAKISLAALTDPPTGVIPLERRIVRLGFPLGAGFRTGNSTKVRYAVRLRGAIQKTFPVIYPMLLVTLMTNPPDLSDSDTEFANLLPADREFRSLAFSQVEGLDPLRKQSSKSGADLDDYRQWSVKNYIDQGTSGTVHRKQTDLHISYWYDVTLLRSVPTDQEAIDPNRSATA